jgi:hypothetical protein
VDARLDPRDRHPHIPLVVHPTALSSLAKRRARSNSQRRTCAPTRWAQTAKRLLPHDLGSLSGIGAKLALKAYRVRALMKLLDCHRRGLAATGPADDGAPPQTQSAPVPVRAAYELARIGP